MASYIYSLGKSGERIKAEKEENMEMYGFSQTQAENGDSDDQEEE